jgi:hypothetical protein
MALTYTTDNLLTSLQIALANALRAFGYDILWKATDTREAQTAGLDTPKGTITLLPAFPANPAYLVRSAGLNDGNIPKDEEITVPAFSLRLPTAPKKIRRMGIGEHEFERRRGFTITGFAWDEFQQRELLDFFYEWLDGGDVYLPVWDYTSDPATPLPLNPVQVERVDVISGELVTEVEAVRYPLSASAVISYIE